MKQLIVNIVFGLAVSFMAAQGGRLTGYYQSTFGTLALIEETNQANTSKSETILYGDYKDLGTILANVAPQGNNLYKIEGNFFNKQNQGSFEWMLSRYNNALPNFQGKWGWGNSLDKGNWNGSVKSYNQAVKIQMAQWSGNWDTTFGKIFLRQNGNKVTGDYKNVGTIEGTITQNILRGKFTNNGSVGSFEFVLNGNNFTGKWGWGNLTNKGSWNGNKSLKTNQERVEQNTTNQQNKPSSSSENKTTKLRYRLTLDRIYAPSIDDLGPTNRPSYELYGIAWCRAYDYNGKQIQPFDVTYADKYGRFWEIKPKDRVRIYWRYGTAYTINKSITFDFPVDNKKDINEVLKYSKIELTVELKDYDKLSKNDILGKERVTIPLNEATITKRKDNQLPETTDKGVVNIKHGRGHLMVTFYIEKL